MQQKANNYAFIDANNLNLSVRDAGWEVDYQKLRVYLGEKYGVQQAYLFLGFVPQFQRMYQRLQEQGYVLVFKPTTTNSVGEIKGNCDVLLTLHTLLALPDCEQAVLITNDGDFAPLVDHMASLGKLRAVFSPQRKKCSPLLRKSGRDKMFYLDDLKERIGRADN